MRKTKRLLLRGKGFTLTEMAIVLLIVGLLAGAILPIAGTMLDQQSRRETANKLAALDQALLNFVMTNKRLPCPADGTTASAVAGAGVEQRIPATGACNPANEINGVVPWATLGLGEAAGTDAWGTRFTYRVQTNPNGFTRDNALDATACDPAAADPAANAITTFCPTSPKGFVQNRGLAVLDEAGTPINHPGNGTGAAYVLISHGRIGGGGYNSAGNLVTSSTPAGNNERQNWNNRAIWPPPAPAIPLTAPTPASSYFHDSRLMEDTASNTHFDDLVSHPTIMSLLLQAQLAPRKP